MQEILDTYHLAEKIFESNLDWEDKFDLIFSKEISGNVKLNYYDPDTSYEEDVRAFMNAFQKRVNKLDK
jgi:hypothetical protein